MASRISVIVPVHNTERYLERCFGSVADQSLSQDLIEVIAVDDGSSDGSGAWLDAWALTHDNVRVIHQPPSGGAGRPRNVGIEQAKGDFLFFLDSDDYLGVEALERLLRMADEQDSDIVYGRIVGIGGRPAPVDLRTTSPEVSIFHSPVYWTLAAYKLWRRTLVEEYELRFTEARLLGEDVPFAVHGLLHARKVSVVADYDCYYLEGRGDGTNASQQDVDWVAQLEYVSGILGMVADHVPAGPERDKLMERHFHGEVLGMFGAPYLARDEEGRRAMAEAARPLCQEWLTDGVSQALPPRLRLRAHCLREGMTDRLTAIIEADVERELGPAVIEGDSAYAAYPFFRDPDAGIPDACYDVTSRVVLRQELTSYTWDGPVLRLSGKARLDGLGDPAGQEVGLVLGCQGVTYTVPATNENGVYTAAVDVSRAADGGPLAEGVWTLRVAVASGTLRKQAWLPRPADRAYDAAPQSEIVRAENGPIAVAVFHSEAHQHVNLDIGATRFPLGSDARGAVNSGFFGRSDLEFAVTVPGWSAPSARLLLTAPNREPLLVAGAESVDGDGRIQARIPLQRVPAGNWNARIHLEDGAFTRDLPIADPEGEPLRLSIPQQPLRRLGSKAKKVASRALRNH
ncbi:glycosyltransferase family 2 protein [Streptomyces sp. NPDC059567]|uniref:glycosyltransferase family 2 protein n=1 Tax=Streptomyces sp. NPDC059567 TaxID=3346867 RepID=UPI0036B61FBC